MARALITIVVLTVVIAYLAMFLHWNATALPITVLQFGDTAVQQDMLVALLLFIGVFIGALAMFGALKGPWSSLKESEGHSKALVEKAKAKLKSQDKKIKELTKQLEEAQEASADAASPEVSEEVAKAVEAVSDEPGDMQPPPPATVAPNDDEEATDQGEKKEEVADDPEVI